jgi:hypothetical protein
MGDKLRCFLLLLLISFVFSGRLAAQSGEDPAVSSPAEQAAETEQALEPESPVQDDSLRVYYIRDIKFNITGRTRPFALIKAGEFKTGERLVGKTALENYISQKTQLLNNQRVLEAVLIEYTQEDTGDATAVDLLIHTKDTMNFIAVPWFQYDTNEGFELTVKARDYNFLGGMNPLRIDLGYNLDENNENSFFLDLDSDTPFEFLGYVWTFNFDNSFAYTFDEPFYYKNVTGLSMDLPWRATTFTFGFGQGFVLNEKNEDAGAVLLEGEYFPDTWYMYSELYTQWKVPVGLTVGTFGDLNYTPRVSGKMNYRPGGSIGEYRRGPSVTFAHNLGFSQINWIGNYRQGLEASLDNSNTYNIYKQDWDIILTLQSAGYLTLTDFFGITARLRYKHWFNNPEEEAGDVLRGIINDTIYADYMLSLNMDLPIRLVRFLPSQWWPDIPKALKWMHYLDLEWHWSPFLDLALVNDPKAGRDFSFNDMIVAGGLEVITYPLRWRSIYIRISAGMDLKKVLESKDLLSKDNLEIFIGFGYHY